MIGLEGVVKTYSSRAGKGDAAAVRGITFTVSDGEFYTLLGPSGCGKSTTLRCIAGLERPEAGTVRFNGEIVASRERFVPANRRDIGMVFQSYAVWPHMTVFDNVAFPLRVRHRSRGTRNRRQLVLESLSLVGLADLADRPSTHLSGGEQQRLALARAIVDKPSVLLLDEPLSNLDAALRERMRGEIRLLQQQLKITTVFVTHDQSEALSMSDRIAVMNDGRIVQEGSPREIYYEVQDEFVARFIGAMNIVTGRLHSGGSHGVLQLETGFGVVHIEAGMGTVAVPDGRTSAIAVRPEDIVMTLGEDRGPQESGNIFDGRIQVSLFGGTYTDYSVALASGHLLRVRTSSRSAFRQGERVQVQFPPANCRLLAQPLLDERRVHSDEHPPEQGPAARVRLSDPAPLQDSTL